jgi:S1-C subfamily serine protease
VKPSSAAERAGVKKDDIIIAIDGNMITSHNDFVNVVAALGRPISIRLVLSPSSA